MHCTHQQVSLIHVIPLKFWRRLSQTDNSFTAIIWPWTGFVNCSDTPPLGKALPTDNSGLLLNFKDLTESEWLIWDNCIHKKIVPTLLHTRKVTQQSPYLLLLTHRHLYVISIETIIRWSMDSSYFVVDKIPSILPIKHYLRIGEEVILCFEKETPKDLHR